ncbi:hypothetical protein [Arthrobacter sp. N1]|uniref:hypothetical protein n=1 Tax=Arthrobacter sp. N1 TaxID=619291 RepID=UPI003BAE2195
MTQHGTGQRGAGPSGTGGTGHDGGSGGAMASARLWLRLFLLALLLGVLTSSLVLPWKVLTLVLSLFALAAGVVALVKAIRLKLPRLVVLATSMGLAAALFLAAGTAASVLLWSVTRTYEDCIARALTLQAQEDCQDGLKRLDGLG